MKFLISSTFNNYKQLGFNICPVAPYRTPGPLGWWWQLSWGQHGIVHFYETSSAEAAIAMFHNKFVQDPSAKPVRKLIYQTPSAKSA